MPSDAASVRRKVSGVASAPEEPAATSTTSALLALTRSWMSAFCSHTVTRLVIGLAPHHLSLATRTTAPPSNTDSILYGPDDGKCLATTPDSVPGLRFQVVFHVCAMRAMTGALLPSSDAVTSTPSSSAITCDGRIAVAVNSWL